MTARVRQIGVVQQELGIGPVRILIDRLEPFGIERRGPPDQAMNFVAFVEQKLRQIRTVLARHTGNECLAHCGHYLNRKHNFAKLEFVAALNDDPPWHLLP